MAAPNKLATVCERSYLTITQAYQRYEYRWTHAALKRDGIAISERVVRRLMREDGLDVAGNKRGK